MKTEDAINCLMDKTLCKFCKNQSENCRQDAIDTAVRSMEAWEKINGEIYKTKHSLKVENADYRTGYLSALSYVEGLIAEHMERSEKMKFTKISRSFFEELQGFPLTENNETEVDKTKLCCGNCAYYEADYPHKICHKKEKSMKGDMRIKVCNYCVLGHWDRYNNRPILREVEE